MNEALRHTTTYHLCRVGRTKGKDKRLRKISTNFNSNLCPFTHISRYIFALSDHWSRVLYNIEQRAKNMEQLGHFDDLICPCNTFDASLHDHE